jgi:hypothetical protein
MTLDAAEFIRRFLLHVLPAGFHRIRHYGWLGNATARASWPGAARCWPCRRSTRPPPAPATTGTSTRRSPGSRSACVRSASTARWCGSPDCPRALAPRPVEGPDALAPYHPAVSTARWGRPRRPMGSVSPAPHPRERPSAGGFPARVPGRRRPRITPHDPRHGALDPVRPRRRPGLSALPPVQSPYRRPGPAVLSNRSLAHRARAAGFPPARVARRDRWPKNPLYHLAPGPDKPPPLKIPAALAW